MHYAGFVVVIVMLSGVIIAQVAGILTRLAGGSYVAAVQSGGMSFAATVTLGILLATTLGALQ
jgi:hypothetical protein